MRNDMKKLIFFDLDGTLVPINTWHLFNIYFGMSEAEDAIMFDWYKRGLLSYCDWYAMISKIIKEKGQCTKDKVVEFVKTIVPCPDAESLIGACKEAGYTSVILSGTMKQIAEDFGHRLGIAISHTSSQIVFAEDGSFEDIITQSDQALNKLQMFEQICAEYNVDPAETIMVGDGNNDIEVFKRTKKAIQIDNNEQLKSYAWKHVENLSEIKTLI